MTDDKYRLPSSPLVRIHSVVPKRSDDPRSGPLERHRIAIRSLIRLERPLANSKSPHRLFVKLHIKQIEDIAPDQKPVLLRRDRAENSIKDLRGTEYLPELRASLHPKKIEKVRFTLAEGVILVKHALRQRPRSGVRDHGVGKIGNRGHHLAFVFGSRRFDPDAAILGEGDVP